MNRTTKPTMKLPLKTIVLGMFAVLALGFGTAAVHQDAQAAAVVNYEDNILNIEINQAVMVKLDKGAKSVFVANPLMADIQVKSPTLIYVFGLRPGTTTFYAVDENDNVIYGAKLVIQQNIDYLQDTINKLLPNASINVESVNGLIILTGFAQSPEEADLAQQIVQQSIVVKVVNGNVVQEAVEVRVINRIQISTPTQVNIRVKMAEMSRDTLKTLGFNWELSGIAGSFFGFGQGRDFIEEILDDDGNLIGRNFLRPEDTNSFVFSDTKGFLDADDNLIITRDINAMIDALETEGYLSILAEPNITAISGETASFLAGGEFPVPIPQSGLSDAITVEFKTFGVSLHFTPTVVSENKIILNVAPEVSQLSSAGAITINNLTIPALTSRRAHTVVELASGQSFAIAGLLQSSITQDAQKVPWLGDIPILGTLFRSDAFRRQETELVIIVTPYIVRPVNERLLGPTDINSLPQDAGQYIKGPRTLSGNGGLKVDK